MTVMTGASYSEHPDDASLTWLLLLPTFPPYPSPQRPRRSFLQPPAAPLEILHSTSINAIADHRRLTRDVLDNSFDSLASLRRKFADGQVILDLHPANCLLLSSRMLRIGRAFKAETMAKADIGRLTKLHGIRRWFGLDAAVSGGSRSRQYASYCDVSTRDSFDWSLSLSPCPVTIRSHHACREEKTYNGSLSWLAREDRLISKDLLTFPR